MNCKNCGNSVSGNFCSHCGQRTNVDTISFRTLRAELQNNIFQINKGFFFTIKELAIRPGNAIRNFLEGKRKPYYKPISFLLVSATLYIFAAYLFGVDSFLSNTLNSFKEGWDSASPSNNKIVLKDYGLLDWLRANQVYLVFVLLPIYSLASFVAFFKSKYNYYEHLVIQLYITGQQFFFLTIFTCLLFFNNEVLGIAILFSSVLYSIFTYNQFFKETSLAVIILRYILLQVLFFILYFIISFVTLFIGIILSKLI